MLCPLYENIGDIIKVYFANKTREENFLKAFYKQNAKTLQNKKAIISERFQDENGNAIVWEIKPLLQKQNEMILKKCRAMQKQQNFYEVMVLAESVVFPDLENIQLQNHYHVVGKEALLLELLTAGEYEKLKNMVEQI